MAVGLVFDYTHKVRLLYVLIIVDIFINNIFDPVSTFIGQLALFFFQAALILFKIVLLLFLFKSTYLFQFDIGRLLGEFKVTVAVMPLNLAFLVVVRAYRIVLALRHLPAQGVWDQSGFFALFVIHKLIGIIYYLSLYHSSIRLSEKSFYRRIAPRATTTTTTNNSNASATAIRAGSETPR